jgi:hypothetical protein
MGVTTTETVQGREFQIDTYPDLWHQMTFEGKATWLTRHTRPRATYSEACSILRAHAAARRAKDKETLVAGEREIEEKVRTGAPILTLEQAGAYLVPGFSRAHAGYTLAELLTREAAYLRWMAGRDWIRGKLREAILVMCHHHRDAIEADVRARRGRPYGYGPAEQSTPIAAAPDEEGDVPW